MRSKAKIVLNPRSNEATHLQGVNLVLISLRFTTTLYVRASTFYRGVQFYYRNYFQAEQQSNYLFIPDDFRYHFLCGRLECQDKNSRIIEPSTCVFSRELSANTSFYTFTIRLPGPGSFNTI